MYTHFDLIRPQTWLPHAILFSEWSIPKNSSSLKSLGQMYRNLVGSIYGRFSIKIVQQELAMVSMFINGSG
jgi:hypothetical protein